MGRWILEGRMRKSLGSRLVWACLTCLSCVGQNTKSLVTSNALSTLRLLLVKNSGTNGGDSDLTHSHSFVGSFVCSFVRSLVRSFFSRLFVGSFVRFVIDWYVCMFMFWILFHPSSVCFFFLSFRNSSTNAAVSQFKGTAAKVSNLLPSLVAIKAYMGWPPSVTLFCRRLRGNCQGFKSGIHGGRRGVCSPR